VLLVDHRVLIREALSALINREPDLLVVGQADSVGSALRLVATPDVIITDVDLPDARDGAVIGQLRRVFPQSPLLVLSLVDHPARVESVLAAGASGYLLQTATADVLLDSIRTVASGGTYLPPSLSTSLARWPLPDGSSFNLSSKELQVLRLVALGHTNSEIAGLCAVSLRTVEARRARLRQKLGRHRRAELVEVARDLGLIASDR
jgi:two-component system response regulator NreC